MVLPNSFTEAAETITETVKSALPGVSGTPSKPENDTHLSHEEMAKARVPLQYRDKCAHLLIPLNRCRYDTYYMPWKCEDERHSYEKCQYIEFKRRVAKMEELRAERGGRSGLN